MTIAPPRWIDDASVKPSKPPQSLDLGALKISLAPYKHEGMTIFGARWIWHGPEKVRFKDYWFAGDQLIVQVSNSDFFSPDSDSFKGWLKSVGEPGWEQCEFDSSMFLLTWSDGTFFELFEKFAKDAMTTKTVWQAAAYLKDNWSAWSALMQQTTSVELNHLHFAQSYHTDDPAFKDQWGMQAIEAEKAWDEAGSSAWRTMVAIVDSGVDRLHRDLGDNLMSPGNDVEDEEHSHGTFCTGVVGALANRLGIIGAYPEPRLKPIKFIGPGGFGSAWEAAQAIACAVNEGADVILAAWGTHEINGCLYRACEFAQNARDGKGVLIVAAAGNFGEDSDKKRFFPAAFKLRNEARDLLYWLKWVGDEEANTPIELPPLNNILSVGATMGFGFGDQQREYQPCEMKSEASSWGREVVDIGAPGVAIRTTRKNDDQSPGKRLGWAGGTSMAAAFVAGAAGFIKAHRPELRASELRQRIIGSADCLSSLERYWPYGRRLNVYKAIKLDDTELFSEQVPGKGTPVSRQSCDQHMHGHGDDGHQE